MAAAGTDEAGDGSSTLKSEYQTTDKCDPGKTEPALSAVLSSTNQPAFNAQNKSSSDNVQSNANVSDPALQVATDLPSATGGLNGFTERQSQSRSMSRTSSNSSASDQVIITDHNPENMSPQIPDADGSADSVSNGATLQKSTFPSALPDDETSSNHVSPDTDMQGDVVSNAPVNAVSDLVLPATDASALKNSDRASSDALQACSTTDTHIRTQKPLKSAGVSTPKARLPHDKIGMLEDRIKDDLRGDVDAWLNLIDEHKKRGKLEDARNVYERFFAVFPFAVSNAGLTIVAP